MKFDIIIIRYKEDEYGTKSLFLLPEFNANFHAIEKKWLNNQNRISCIPPNIYTAVFEYSAKFKMKLWELKDVPNRAEVKIHIANKETQLEGCIAPGLKANKTGVSDSTKALTQIHKFLEGREKIKIKIIDIR